MRVWVWALLALLIAPIAAVIRPVNCVSSCTYSQIQAVAATALDGDVVDVTGGPYMGPCAPITSLGGTGSVLVRGAGVTVDCQGTGPVINIEYDGSDTISGFTFLNVDPGNASSSALHIHRTNFTVTNCVFRSCVRPIAFDGDNFFGYSSSLTITNSTFLHNGAYDGGNGGAICADSPSSLSIVGCYFEGNTASYAGMAIWIQNSYNPVKSVLISNTSFVRNQLAKQFSYQVVEFSSGDATLITLDRITFYNNSGYQYAPAGIRIAAGDLVIVTNSNFSGGESNSGPMLEVHPAGSGVVSNCYFGDRVGQGAELCGNLENHIVVNDTVFANITQGVTLQCQACSLNRVSILRNSAFQDACNQANVILSHRSAFKDCTFLNNQGNRGGALILMQTAATVIPNATFDGVTFDQNNCASLLDLRVARAVSIRHSFVTNNARNKLDNANPSTAAPFIWAGAAALTIQGTQITNNGRLTDDGSVLMSLAGTVVRITDSTFSSNTGTQIIHGTSTLGTSMSVMNSTFCSNAGLPDSSAVFDLNQVTTNLTGAVIANNAIKAIQVVTADPSCTLYGTDVTIQNNHAQYYGGALYWNGIVASFTRLKMIGNYAGYNGGGFYIGHGDVTLIDSIVTDNTGLTGGGAFTVNFNGSLHLVNTNIDYNIALAPYATAIFCVPPVGSMTTVSSINSIISHQISPAISGCSGNGLADCSTCLFGSCDPITGACDCFNSVPTAFANCTAINSCGKNGSCDFYVNAVSGSDGNNGTTPSSAFRTIATALLLAKAGDVIHLTGTFDGLPPVLRPVIFAGYGQAALGCSGTLTFSAGETLRGLSISSCDFCVNSDGVGFSGVTITGGAFDSSMAALTMNNSLVAGTTLRMNHGTLTLRDTIWRDTAPLAVSIIQANSATVVLENTVFSGLSVPSGNVVSLLSGTLAANNVSLADNTAQSGIALLQSAGVFIGCTVSGMTGVNGGGIQVVQGSMTIANGAFRSNSISGLGGVLYIDRSLTEIFGVVFEDNTANGGGAVALSGGSVAIVSSNFSSNVASLNGGAIYGTLDSGVAMNGVMMTDNTAGGSGGAIQIDTSTNVQSIVACMFRANTAGLTGGALASRAATLLQTTTFDGNSAKDGAAINVTYSLNMTACVVENNVAGGCVSTSGAAIVASGSVALFTGLTARNNQGGLGAACKTTALSVSVSDSVFEDNSCGSALHVGTGATATIDAMTVTGTTGWYGGVSLDANSVVSISGSVIESNTATSATYSLGAGGITCVACQVTIADTRIANNVGTSGAIGAGFACVLQRVVPSLTLDSGVVFAGNVDPLYPGLEADFSACGGCAMRGSLTTGLTFNVTDGVGCVPVASASCGYTCSIPYYATQAAITCTGSVPNVQVGGYCPRSTTCPTLTSADGLVIHQSIPAVNNTQATFDCPTGLVLSDTLPRVCDPPLWTPAGLPTCAAPVGTTGSGGVDSSLSVPIIAGAAGGALFAIIVIVAVILTCCRRRNRSSTNSRRALSETDTTVKASSVAMAELLKDMLLNATVIAQGGSGTVYKAKYEGTVVALKVFREDSIENRLDYHREVKAFTILTQNSSELALAVLELRFISAKPMAIAMEFVDGPSLFDLIRTDGRNLSEIRRMDIIEQLVEVLENFEDRRLAHLDVKTKNILIMKGNTVKLIDYGLSQVTTEPHPLEELTGFTPQYVAPEIAAIAHNVQRQSLSSTNGRFNAVVDYHGADVFSFAVVMWSLCALGEPYPGVPGNEVYAALINDPDRRPSIPEQAHGHWQDIIRDSWSTDPSRRPSFAEIAVRIQSCRDSCFPGPSRRRKPVKANPVQRSEITSRTPPPIVSPVGSYNSTSGAPMAYASTGTAYASNPAYGSAGQLYGSSNSA